jgi:hypothetical protein
MHVVGLDHVVVNTYSDATKDSGVFKVRWFYVMPLIFIGLLTFTASGKSRDYFVGSL